MRRISRIFIFAILLCFPIMKGWTQDLSRRFSLGLQGGICKPGLSDHSDIYNVGNQIGGSFKYNMKDKISLTFTATYALVWEADLSGLGGSGAGFTLSRKKDANKFAQVWLDAGLIYHFRPLERLNPFIVGGAGIVFWNIKDKNGKYVEALDLNEKPFDLKDQEITIIGGGGLEYRIKEKWSLVFSTKFHYCTHTLTSFTGAKDIVGTAPGELDLPKATLDVSLGLNYYFGKLKDSDKDGVPDQRDFCADTPRGAKVDEKGCPIDLDGDGIYDGLDKCPNTPPGAKVDANGCPL